MSESLDEGRCCVAAVDPQTALFEVLRLQSRPAANLQHLTCERTCREFVEEDRDRLGNRAG